MALLFAIQAAKKGDFARNGTLASRSSVAGQFKHPSITCCLHIMFTALLAQSNKTAGNGNIDTPGTVYYSFLIDRLPARVVISLSFASAKA